MLALIRAKARLILPVWPWIALFSCALMLGLAHYAQRVDGLAPCILCLKQREAYWAAGAIAAAGVVLGFTPWKGRATRLVNIALALAFLYGMGMAIYHMGAEMKWWPGPKACAVGGASSAAEIADLLAGRSPRIVSCEDPVYWPIPGFITMAAWNVIISLKLAGWSIAAAMWRPRP